MRLRMLATAALASAVLLSLPSEPAAGAAEWVDATFDAFEDHLERHPKAEARDGYKFLFQSVLGPGHAIPSREAAVAYLESELASLTPITAAEPLCEPLGGAPAMVRIHLRPFLASGGDPERLLEAFMTSADEVVIDRQRFDRALIEAPQRLRSLGRQGLAAGLDRLAEQMRAQDLPALHHSDAFREAYGPAYRVILESLADANGWCAPPAEGGAADRVRGSEPQTGAPAAPCGAPPVEPTP